MNERPDENFRERVTASYARQNIMRTIGAELTSVEYGVVEIEMPRQVHHVCLEVGIESDAWILEEIATR